MPMPSVAMQMKKNDQAAVVSMAAPLLYCRRPEAELDGEQLCAPDGVGGSVRRPHCAPRAPGFAEGGSVGEGGLYGVAGRGGVVELGEEAGGGAPALNA